MGIMNEMVKIHDERETLKSDMQRIAIYYKAEKITDEVIR